MLLADFLNQINEGPKNYFIDFDKGLNDEIDPMGRRDKVEKLIIADLFR